jgi:hypothetical protein
VPPPGTRVDFGRTRRTFPPAAADYIRDRDRSCAIPTCAVRATHLDIDHRHDWAAGGTTDATNAGPGCTHHNRTTRNRSTWRIEPNGDGTATLITPHGRRYPITPYYYGNF